jgi:RepB plasmid partitioning protein
MVVAQGKENSERRDLSFIEPAVFALHLAERGFDRNIFMAALSIDKAETAKLLGQATGIRYHLEHVFPESLRGTNEIDNLALACPTAIITNRTVYWAPTKTAWRPL